MSRILFVNAPSRKRVYSETNVGAAAPSYPNLTIATLAAHLTVEHIVQVIDLDFFMEPHSALLCKLKAFRPDVVACSVKTPDYILIRDLFRSIKNECSSVLTVVGGVHVTALPEEASAESCFDVIVKGEGDTVLQEMLSATSLAGIPGVMWMNQSGNREINRERSLISDLDELPYPEWSLFDLQQYKNSHLSSRINPVGHIETSRGCAYSCNFCNKQIFGNRFRVKAPHRVVDEMEYMLKCGFKEIHIADDSFTQNIDRAKEICIEIKRRKLRFPWSLINGVRVNMVDHEFFHLAKSAGLWQVGFGIESGDQTVLDRINKQITLSQTEQAVKMAKSAGVDTFGFFVLGLAGETEMSMQTTIDFAKSLPLDTAKFDICIPYPGTPFYEELEKAGRIITKDWSHYICHQTSKPLFNHPTVDWDTIDKFYRQSFHSFYFRPSYIFHRTLRSLRMGDAISDLMLLLKSFWRN